MARMIPLGLILGALALNAFAQDWYREREHRYRGEEWRPHIFLHVRTDLDHVWSAFRATEKERRRLERTKEELTKMRRILITTDGITDS